MGPGLVPPRGRRSDARKGPTARVNWRSLLCGRVQLVIYANHASSAWLSYLLLTELPTFAKDALRLSEDQASLVVATPYLLMGFGLILGGKACDAAIVYGYRRSTVRIVCQVVGSVFCGSFLVSAAALARTRVYASVVCLNLGALCYVGQGLGVCTIFLELANADPGLFYAVSNMLATIPGILVPLATSALLGRFSEGRGWLFCFSIGLAVVAPTAALFVSTFLGEDLAPRKSIVRRAYSRDLAEPLLLDDAITDLDTDPLRPRTASQVIEALDEAAPRNSRQVTHV